MFYGCGRFGSSLLLINGINMKLLIVCFIALVLAGCGSNSPEEYLGEYPSVWENNERLLLKIDQAGVDYTAEFYGPSIINSRLEKHVFPASTNGEEFSIAYGRGTKLVSYDAESQSLILTDAISKIEERFRKLTSEEAKERIARLDKLFALLKPITCELTGSAKLTKDYGDLLEGDVLDVQLSFNHDGNLGVPRELQPVAENAKMRVSHANGTSLESHVTKVQVWDRKTSESSFLLRVLGAYIRGNIGGISGPPVPPDIEQGWRPGIEFFGDPAGTELDGRFPVSAEDWKLLNRQTLTLPDPKNKNSITQVARFDKMTVQCEYSARK